MQVLRREAERLTLRERERETFWRRTEALAAERPVLPLRNGKARWCRPEIWVQARHLKGSGLIRHAALAEVL